MDTKQLLVGLAAGLVLVAAVATAAETSTEGEPEAKEAARHSICHIEIPSTDYAQSKEFCERVFGWKVTLVPEMNYALWQPEEGPGGGFSLVKEPCTCEEGCGVAYVNVASVEDKAKEIEAAGGTVKVPKTAVADMGWFVVFQDPAGGVAALWESAKKE